jgi:hypothetical protein
MRPKQSVLKGSNAEAIRTGVSVGVGALLALLGCIFYTHWRHKSLATRVEGALKTKKMWGMPEVHDLFERQEVAAIVDAVESPIRMWMAAP